MFNIVTTLPLDVLEVDTVDVTLLIL